MAVRAPFSRAAEGVRLPDGNPLLSTTLALTQKVQLQSNASGEVDVTILPNLSCHSFTTRGNLSGGLQLALATTTGTPDTLFTTTTTTNARGFGFDVETLKAQYSRYRIAAYGARLRATAGTSVAGEFTCAVMPLKGQAPVFSASQPAVLRGSDGAASSINSYWGVSGPRGTLSEIMTHMGLPVSGTDNSAVLDYTKLTNTPMHAVASSAQVAARGLHMRGMPFEASARDYITTAFGALGTDSVDVGTVVGTAVASSYAQQQYAVDMSFLRVGGTESIVIGGSGFPASTVIGTVEIIFHVEAITNPQYAVLVRPTGQAPVAKSSQTIDQVLTTLHRIPRISFADVVQTVGDSMLGEIEGRAGAAAGGAVSSVAGMLGRLLMAGV